MVVNVNVGKKKKKNKKKKLDFEGRAFSMWTCLHDFPFASSQACGNI